MSNGHLHRVLLRTYSPAFRERYGAEMLDGLAEENSSASIATRIGHDVDFARNGMVQRVGVTVADDVESGMRWAATGALGICIAWSLVSLSRSIPWTSWLPSNATVAAIWSVVLIASTARLLLPARSGRRILVVGIAFTGFVTTTGFVGSPPVPAGFVGTVDSVLRWQTATVLLLLCVGLLAQPATRRVGITAAGAGTVGGALLALRVDMVMTDRAFGTNLAAPVGRWAALLPQGMFLDLTRLDLVPAIGWWWLGIAAALSLTGWFRPRFAIAAIVLTSPIVVALLLRWFADIGTAPKFESMVIAVALFVLAESIAALAFNWRSNDREVAA